MFIHEIYRECYDPIQQAIDIQLGNPAFNDYPSIETIIISAIDEKYSRLSNNYKRLISLKMQGFNREQIADKTGISTTTQWRMLKKMKRFTEIRSECLRVKE